MKQPTGVSQGGQGVCQTGAFESPTKPGNVESDFGVTHSYPWPGELQLLQQEQATEDEQTWNSLERSIYLAGNRFPRFRNG